MKKWLFFLLVIGVFYFPSLNYGFSQDDFFHLFLARANSLTEVLHFFTIQPGSWIFFRPLSTELYYFTFSSIFGLAGTPMAMHIFMLLLHTTNSYLVSRVADRIKGVSTNRANLIGLLYGIWGVHFLSLYYIGATQQLFMMFFTLLTLIFLTQKKLIPQLLMIALALLSKELSVRIPFVIFFYLLLTGIDLKQAIKRALPSVCMISTYLAFRTLLGVATPPEYALSFSPFTTIATLMWYLLMSLGLPEYILNFGLSMGRVDLFSYATSLGWFSILSTLSFVSISALTIFSLFTTLRTHRSRVLALAGLWLSSILPVILLPTHRYAHYLDIATLALFTLIVTTLHKRLLYPLIAISIALSFTSLRIDQLTHWTVSRATTASYLIERLEAGQACDYTTWNITGSEEVIKQVGYAMLFDNFAPVYCHHDVDLVYNGPLMNNHFTLELSESDLRQ